MDVRQGPISLEKQEQPPETTILEGKWNPHSMQQSVGLLEIKLVLVNRGVVVSVTHDLHSNLPQ